MAVELRDDQRAVAQGAPSGSVFLQGPAGSGKTTAGIARLRHLLETGVPADSISVIVPQRTLARPYLEALRQPDIPTGGMVNVATISGIARRMIDLFWPLVAEEAGFVSPDERPSFLTLETAQYYMAHVVGPLIDQEAYFESITIDRNRLYSQILDNLNKSAVVGFPPSEIAARLKGAWMGEQSQARVYDEAQTCAMQFRRYCLAHNLLDFSLQLAVFVDHLWEEPLCRDHLLETYTHLIVDNVEEDTPVAHDIIYTWVGQAESALVIFDQEAGYRSFLGADPESAWMIRDLCDRTVTFERSFVVGDDVAALSQALGGVLAPAPGMQSEAVTGPAPDSDEAAAPDEMSAAGPATVPEATALPLSQTQMQRVLHFENHRFHPQMLDWVAEQIGDLVHRQDVAPSEIVVLAPFLSDALRFSLGHRLAQLDVPVRSHRPSRALRDEPATQTLLTLAALAHPAWHIAPTQHDVTHALMHAIADLDLVRAQLLSQIVYRPRDGQPFLSSFADLNTGMQQRITFALGERYERLRDQLVAYAGDEPVPLDHYLARLFGELLSQPGYGFYRDLDGGRVVAMLIESVQKFRWISPDLPPDRPIGLEYLTMVREGVIAAQYLQSWRAEPDEAVLLAPAYTFLLTNRPVDVQVWLDIGGQGWWERLYQPLTHPYVLSRRWPVGKPWTDTDEFALRQTMLYRQIMGLLRRCRRAVYLGLSEYSEQGFEQEGPLLRAVQRVLRRAVMG